MPIKSRDPVAYAHAIAARLADVKTAAELKKPIAAFRAALARHDVAATAAVRAREARDAALASVAAADDVLDPSVDALATAMVGAGVTKRARAFLGYSSYGPSDLQALAYATEAKEVEKLVAALAKKKAPAAVAKAAALASKNARAVTAALAALVKPDAAYAKALVAREAAVPALVKATSKLKRQAALVWEDDEPETYASVFAPPELVQAPKSPVAKKAARTRKGKAAPAGGASTGNGSVVATPPPATPGA